MQTAVKAGNKLRGQIIGAIEELGNGFAESLGIDEFKNVRVKDFYAEILNITYRLLLLSFAEQKGWLPARNGIYDRTYSLNVLTEIAVTGNYNLKEEYNLWEHLKVTFGMIANGHTLKNGEKINGFGSQLFSDKKITLIKDLSLRNKYLLQAIYQLNYLEPGNLDSRIDYSNMAVDELGSVYESLLGYEPKIARENNTHDKREIRRGNFYLDDKGTDRKTTGSYYTDSRLVAQLIQSALVPVINNALTGKTSIEEKEKALLDLKVADIACGSGVFICAALEKMGEQLAMIRMNNGKSPGEEQLREAKRDVLKHCIYGVDLNPMALELAKFSLWVTASMPDIPLTFLDHKLKCGNSLIGATPELISKGIPEEAYKPVGNDNVAVCNELKRKIRKEREKLKQINKSAFQTEKMKHKFKDLLMADMWTAAFFIKRSEAELEIYPTNTTLDDLNENKPINKKLVESILKLADQYKFFHFYLEFPEVFEKGGFDCLLGNPPWEKINFEDEEFFISRSPEIAVAINKSERKKLMAALPEEDPQLFQEYLSAKRWNDCLSVFFLESGAFPYTGLSRVNLYSIFIEQYQKLINTNGYTGNVLPTGIILDNNNKEFYFYLNENEKIDTVIDYENKTGLFPGVHRMYRFCLFITCGQGGRGLYKFFQLEPGCDDDFIRIKPEDIITINPNSKTCPSFRSNRDYIIAKEIYRNNRVLLNEDSPDLNPYNIEIKTPFNMSNDSGLFKSFDKHYLPLYEAKYIYLYTHRYASWENNSTEYSTVKQLQDPNYEIKTLYYLEENEVISRFGSPDWNLVYRMITNPGNERTMIASIIPAAPCGNSLSILSGESLVNSMLLLGNLNSMAFDFLARQKVGSVNFNHWILKQLPVVNHLDMSERIIEELINKVFALTYTSHSLDGMARELGRDTTPFAYDPEQRFRLICEIDLIYFHLYAISKEDVVYILDTFPICKRKEIDKYGSYRTKEAILKLYDEYAWVKKEIKQREVIKIQ